MLTILITFCDFSLDFTDRVTSVFVHYIVKSLQIRVKKNSVYIQIITYMQ